MVIKINDTEANLEDLLDGFALKIVQVVKQSSTGMTCMKIA